jgi:tRNA (guanine-N7-)-methyltransferase
VNSPLDRPESLELALSDADAAPLDWAAVFGRPAPVAIEIGCGNGYFIENEAARLGDWNFVGVERAHEFYWKMVKRCWRRGLTNVRAASIDALEFLGRWTPPGSVHRIYLYFSDPWPKRKHARRRVFGQPFLELAERALAPGGEVWFKTDVGWHFNLAVTAARLRPGWRLWDAGPAALSDPERGEVVSNFERKAREQDVRIWGFKCAPTQERHEKVTANGDQA